MSTIVIYRSKYGSTKKYAEWIAEELGCNILEFKEAKIENLMKYDTIIYGGGLYAEVINGVYLLTKNFDKLYNLSDCASNYSDAFDTYNNNSIVSVIYDTTSEKFNLIKVRNGNYIGKRSICKRKPAPGEEIRHLRCDSGLWAAESAGQESLREAFWQITC